MSVDSAIEAPAILAAPPSPYVGLVPFTEADAAFFFGRSAEAAIVAANLRAARLTIVYGPSGVGKSSLLMAGAVQRLREEAREATESPFTVCVYQSWRDDPVSGLQEAARVALQESAGESAAPLPGEATLAEALRAWTDRAGMLLLVLDQFEEYFQYHPKEGDDERLTGFAAELARIVNDPTLPVNVLLSIREDAWAKLDRFEGHIPLLFANYLRVDHLDLDAAREAIEGPIAAWNRALPPGSEPYSIEPALTKAVLEAAAGGGLTLTAGGEIPAVADDAAGDRVEAPFLQLVLERLWRKTVADDAHELTVARLESLGGARRIVENHLLDALGRLTPEEQDAASDCFRFLVSSSKTKITHSAADLTEWTQRPEPQVTGVLDKLCAGESGRILRPVAPAQDEGSTGYELLHDIIAEPILAWRRRHDAERSHRAARRRLIRVVSVSLALVAVFAAVGIWGWLERNRAEDSLRTAKSLVLAAKALELAGNTDANARSPMLLLALRANQIGATVQARSVMTLALEKKLKPRIIATRAGPGGPVDSVAFSPDGLTMATGGDDGAVQLWDVTDARSPKPRARLLGHDGAVNSVAFSPDGLTLATGGDDASVRLWRVRSGLLLGAPLAGHAGAVNSVAFSADGDTLATAGNDATIRLWDVTDRAHPTTTNDPLVNNRPSPTQPGPAAFESVAFSGDGQELEAVSEDGWVQLWDVDNHEPLKGGLQLTASAANIGVFSPDGLTLATADIDGKARLWDVETGEPLGQPLPLAKGERRDHAPVVRSVAFSPDGLTLATGGDDGSVRLWTVLWSDVAKLTSQVCGLVGRQDLNDLVSNFEVRVRPLGVIIPGDLADQVGISCSSQ